jgi:hypothetical protein
MIRHLASVSAVVAAAAFAACGTDPSANEATSPNIPSHLLSISGAQGAPDIGEFELCKIGTSAAFSVTIDGGPASTVELAAGECTLLADTLTLGTGSHSVSVTEVGDPAIGLDSIVAESVSVPFPTPARSSPITGTSTFSAIIDNQQGWLGLFYDSPASLGCTSVQGYWKNHPGVWPAPYSPNATFYTSGQTWLQALGTSPKGNAYYVLARQFIAATLNGANGAFVPANVQAALDAAAAYFADPTASTLTKQQLLALTTQLGSYNSGDEGVPQCP